MTALQRRSLARTALSADEVHRLYAEYTPTSEAGAKFLIFRVIRDLCESHERLRTELQGAEMLLDDAGLLAGKSGPKEEPAARAGEMAVQVIENDGEVD